MLTIRFRCRSIVFLLVKNMDKGRAGLLEILDSDEDKREKIRDVLWNITIKTGLC